jgi:glycine betaine/choline ABC-type transport system substrate-binding protein
VSDAGIVRERVERDYAPLQLVWLPPLGFNGAFAGIVRADDAQRAKVATLSDAAGAAEPWVLAALPEFVRRPDGFATLERAYNLPVKGAARMMDSAAAYAALSAKQVSIIAGRATDGALMAPGTVMLSDDRNAFPPYEAAIVVRQAALAAHPQLQAALARLSGHIPIEAMRRMNSAVDLKQQPPAATAAEFLRAIQ